MKIIIIIIIIIIDDPDGCVKFSFNHHRLRKKILSRNDISAYTNKAITNKYISCYVFWYYYQENKFILLLVI